jgi:hypothetical protein
MKLRFTLLVTVLFALSVAFSPSNVRASAPVDVSFRLVPTQFVPVEIGNWDASGAVTDSDVYVRTDAHGTGSLPGGPGGGDHTGAFQEILVLTGSRGTITLRDESITTATGSAVVWEVASGTGAYAGAKGHGHGAYSFSTGVLSLDGVVALAA